MRGNPETAVKKLAILVMISMLLTAPYDIIDGMWVGGLGSGATSSISRFVGAKNHEKSSQSAEHSLLIFLLDPIVLTIVLLLFHEPLLKLYESSGQSLTQTV